MKLSQFKFDGVRGVIREDGFMRWATISCWLDSLKDSPLKTAATNALNRINQTK